VRGEDDMVILWRKGFFGKGALSRSEPSWKRRVENKIAEAEGGVKSSFQFSFYAWLFFCSVPCSKEAI
jgi:hypothetical protein